MIFERRWMQSYEVLWFFRYENKKWEQSDALTFVNQISQPYIRLCFLRSNRCFLITFVLKLILRRFQKGFVSWKKASYCCPSGAFIFHFLFFIFFYEKIIFINRILLLNFICFILGRLRPFDFLIFFTKNLPETYTIH